MTVMQALVPLVVTNVGTDPVVVKTPGQTDKTVQPNKTIDTHSEKSSEQTQ